MNKKVKKLISLIAVVALLATAAPLANLALTSTAAQAGLFEYEVIDETEVIITSCDKVENSDEITIPATIDKLPVTAIGDNAFSFHDELKTINLPDKLAKIGSSAFEGCTNLESITIPAGVVEISNDAFDLCPSIKSYKVIDGNEEYESDENGVLYNKGKTMLLKYPVGSQAEEFVIPSTVLMVADSAFKDSDNLVKLTIGNSVKSIGKSAFFSCDALESVIIGSGLTEISESAFEYCTALKTITIPDNIKTIREGAFCDCTALEEVIVGKGVTKIEDYAFSYTAPNYYHYLNDKALIRCYKDSYTHKYADENGFKFSFIEPGEDDKFEYYVLNKEITITGYIGELESTLIIPDKIGNYDVTAIADRVFEGNDDIQMLLLSSTLKSIGACAFKDCDLIEEVVIGKALESIGEFAFDGCYSIKAYTVDGNNNFFSYGSQGELFNKDKTTLISFPSGNESKAYTTHDATTTISDYAFVNAKNLEIVVLSSSIKTIGIRAFNGCSGIKELLIPDSVEAIGDYAFANCVALTNITIGSSVKKIGIECLDKCAALKNVYYNGTKEQWAEIDIKEANAVLKAAKLHFIGGIQDALPYLKYSIVNDEVKIIGCDLSARGVLEIPSEINGKPVTAIANFAFYKCSGVTGLILPKGLREIEMMAFKDCTSLKMICMHNNVKSVGTSAFEGCSSMKDLIYLGTVSQLTKMTIGTDNNSFKKSVPVFHGDANSDSKINSSDALLILQHSTGIKNIDGMEFYVADVNIDKKINSSDALLVLQYATGLIEVFNETDEPTENPEQNPAA